MWARLNWYMEHSDVPINFSEFRRKGCWHQWKYENGDMLCPYCGIIQTKQITAVRDPECTFVWWPRKYLRKQYYETLFNKIRGVDMFEFGDRYRDELIASVPEPADWYDIYQTFKAWNLKEWWTCWNVICWQDKKIDYHKKHYDLLLYIDEYWTESTRSKKKINVFYMLFKVVELCGDSVHWVPMKLRTIALTRLDAEWKLICEKFNWKFIPTSKKLNKYKWKP